MNTLSLSLDDIVFENRNKEYGSYDLRRRYTLALLYALVFSLSAITIAVVCPMIYYRYYQYDRTVVFKPEGPNVIERIETKVDPIIPPPPVSIPVVAPPSFVPPKVVDEVDNSAPTMSTATDVIETSSVTTEPVTLELPTATKNVEVIPDQIETIIGPEEPALFKGGELEVFHRWVQEQLVYPQAALDVNLEGRVLVEFTVGPRGLLGDIKIASSADPLLDNEVIRVLKLSPSWSEPRQSGRAVKQHFFMPVFFQIRP
jgi:protein TonB